MMRSFVTLAVALASVAPVFGGDLKDIKHIVLFMQENRAFDHYFGTMAGVRGFQDPNVVVSNNTKKDAFHQPVNSSMQTVSGGPKNDYSPPKDVDELLPWYLGHQGGNWTDRSQCMLAGTNSWQANHASWNWGNIDRWALNNTPYSLGYFKRDDVPLHFALAENFVVGDSYFESQIASTDPNRVTWFSGTINANSSNSGGDVADGGVVIDNNRDPNCLKGSDGAPFSCRPLRWKTVPEYLQDAKIDWRLYQDFDNFGDNTLVEFRQYQLAAKNKTDLARRALSFDGSKRFYEDAKSGKLPQVSYIVGPQYLSEHPPYTARDGAYLQRNIAKALMESPAWNSTVLIVSYDETGGWADHVMAPHASKDVPGEWIHDPYTKDGTLRPTGPGFRLPFYIVSPFTRNGGIFTEMASHESQTLFLEAWANATGKPFFVKEMNTWRREHMSNLVNAFDFDGANTSKPHLPDIPDAHIDPITGQFNGAWECLLRYNGTVQPEVPYGKQNETDALKVEKGIKPVRGNLTEGRYLSFVSQKHRVVASGDKLSVAKDDGDYKKEQLVVIHWQGTAPKDNKFKISTSDKKNYVSKSLSLGDSDKAGVFSITDLGNGKGHKIALVDSKKEVSLSHDGKLSLKDSNGTAFKVFSVSL